MHFWYQLIYSNREKSIVHHVLLKWSTYYQKLKPQAQRRFVLRCIRFYTSIEWTAHKDFKPSRQAKIIISSAFTQITFGLRKHRLKDFDTIFVLPRPYRYIQSDLMFNGDVNLSNGRISLAWPAVERGFQIPDDSLNLCIHEFAHCLMLENRVSIFFYFFQYNHWIKYKELANQKLKKMKAGKSHFLRAYAKTNEMEFFAVALESFFEEPRAFKSHEPELYKALVRLMNQDPLSLDTMD